MGRDFRQRNDGTMRLVDDRRSFPNEDTRRVKFLSLVCKERAQGVRRYGWRHANNGWRVAVSRRGGGEKRVYFVAFLAVPRQWSVTLPPGHRRRPVSWASTMTGRGIRLRANRLYLADLPRERWSRLTSGPPRISRQKWPGFADASLETVVLFHSWEILSRVFLFWNDLDHRFSRSFSCRWDSY